MEIERKYLITTPPKNYENLKKHVIQQGYLNTEPVVRVRRQDDKYFLTYKSKGLMVREEYNLPLTKEAYDHLITKADGRIITKTRYLLPVEGGGDLTIELDIFEGELKGLILAEVEFPTEEAANAFIPPDWFGEDVTFQKTYHNSNLAIHKSHHKEENQ